MSLISILETLLIGPLKLVFEIIYMIANRFLDHPGLSIIVLSLIMNILVLPLYRRADAMQEKARDIDAKLRDGVAHIKKTFSGDERMMILQTYYRQNNYKPTDALNGSVSLLLEVPFFMAAYQFLSNLQLLQGVSLGPIADLGAPDALLVIGGMSINVLPVVMTAVNVVSSAIYLKGFPLKTKIQLYAMALFFLVFLYTSPSGLVFYWTLNNVFSLVKTIFYKVKNPKKLLGILSSVVGLALLVFGAFFFQSDSWKRKMFLIAAGVALQLPLVLVLLLSNVKLKWKAGKAAPDRMLFTLGSVFLAVLIGLLIPSAYIASSPQEFIEPTVFNNPIWLLISTACLSVGTFLIWLQIFYWLASDRGKAIFDKVVWILCGVMLVNYMFFGTKLGTISSLLKYEGPLEFSVVEQLLNLVVMAAVAAVLYILVCKKQKLARMVLLTAVIALAGMGVINGVKIQSSYNQLDQSSVEHSTDPEFTLSKTGKNVVVIMLDRALGEYVPYMMNEKPELKEQFAGFTYYKNTIAYGSSTNFGAPPLLGGYAYTPVEMNIRDTESLKDKHNEALLTMPVLFSQEDYRVTMLNPTYANYQWIPDMRLFNDYPEIDAYNTTGMFKSEEQSLQIIRNNQRNFFCFSVMKTLPLVAQSVLYNGGAYNQAPMKDDVYTAPSQILHSVSTAEGILASFMDHYSVLANLDQLTKISEEEDNTFLLMTNDTTHDPVLLQLPDYTPAEKVDNTAYESRYWRGYMVDGVKLQMTNSYQICHYHINMAAFLQLGNWLDYLRANDVYDNTRIILVSDHGKEVGQLTQLVMGGAEDPAKDLSRYFPLLMVKDFGAQEFTVSETFMTNADVPTLATQDLIEDPRSPFTGRPINSDDKTAHDQLVILSDLYDIGFNNGNTFLPSRWASVSESLWNTDNWSFYDEEIVLKEHTLPQ